MSNGSSLQAAVPRYVGSDFKDVPPGHRHRLYFEYWNQSWAPPREAKLEVLQKVTSFPRPAQEQLEALLKRQRSLAEKLGALTFDVATAAPFVTGMGIEHPMENGFAFLDPYGLPYLPGSSVKGVVRRAAEELSLFEEDSKGWSIPAVWWLFGFDGNAAYLQPTDREENARWQKAFIDRTKGDDPLLSSFFDAIKDQVPPEEPFQKGTLCERLQKSQTLRRSIHIKGALDFWDVLPRTPEQNLRVDIMNPHYSHYYQQGEPPGDWGSPNPIFFLALPSGTSFVFHVRFLNRDGLPAWFAESVDGSPRWKRLTEAAMGFAFEWLGFGAKTAVGYGRMAASGSAKVSAANAEGNSGRTASQEVASDFAARKSALMASIESRIEGFPSGKNPVAELDDLLNVLGRNRKDPDAPALAVRLWDKVKGKPYGQRLRKNGVVWELVAKGGGS